MPTIQDSRILIKSSTATGVEPTVPASNDHTDGTWLITDLYKGELFINQADDKIFTRTEAGILQIYPVTIPATSSEVTDAPTISLLEDDANWTDNIYTGTAITTQASGDFYISTTHDYKFFTLLGTATARRIPFKLL